MTGRRHKCHWPDCAETVPAWQWGCREHFRALPPEHRDVLARMKHYWPEAKAAWAAAATWARKHLSDKAAACRRCGGPPSPRLVRYCVQCHIADVTGDRS